MEQVAEATAQMLAVRLAAFEDPPGLLKNEDTEDTQDKPRLSTLLNCTVSAPGKQQSTRIRCLMKALHAAVGPLAIAFVCQGNAAMRRQVR
jgi:hypothetical protein